MPSSTFISSIGLEMTKVPAGEFIIGSPEEESGRRDWEQRAKVTLGHDFYLGKTPVTQGQYTAVTGPNPADFSEAGEDAPAGSVNWDDAVKFYRLLTEIDRKAGVLEASWAYRLPTETQWEYACRARTSGARYGDLDAVAWYHDNAQGRTHPVAQKMPNDWGFYDMLGNVWEWCQDWLLLGQGIRTVRGGSWFNGARMCRSAARNGFMPGNRG